MVDGRNGDCVDDNWRGFTARVVRLIWAEAMKYDLPRSPHASRSLPGSPMRGLTDFACGITPSRVRLTIVRCNCVDLGCQKEWF